jgi:hypothetical protein
MTREGVVSGIHPTVMNLHTIANVFLDTLKGYSNALNRKKRFPRLVSKKEGVCFEVAYATKKLVQRISIAPQPMYL